MSGLTKAQRDVLEAISDWSAGWEVAERLFGQPSIAASRGVVAVLGRLRNLGLAEFSKANATFRITPMGRAALNSVAGGEG